MKRVLSVRRSQMRVDMCGVRWKEVVRGGRRMERLRKQAEQALKSGIVRTVSDVVPAPEEEEEGPATRYQDCREGTRPVQGWPPSGGRVIWYSSSRWLRPSFMVCTKARRAQGWLREQRTLSSMGRGRLGTKRLRKRVELIWDMQDGQMSRWVMPMMVYQSRWPAMAMERGQGEREKLGSSVELERRVGSAVGTVELRGRMLLELDMTAGDRDETWRCADDASGLPRDVGGRERSLLEESLDDLLFSEYATRELSR